MSAQLITWLADLLFHSLWLGAIAGGCGWLGIWVVRPNPFARHAVAFTTLLLLGVGLIMIGVWTWPRSTVQPALSMVAMPEAQLPATVHAVPTSQSWVVSAPVATLVATPVDYRSALVSAWLLGIGLLAAWHSLGWWRVHRWRRTARPASAALEALVVVLAQRICIPAPSIRLSATLASPAILGWWRPLVLLPVELASGLPAAQLEALLLHELAHLQRRDWQIATILASFELLLFYHPAVWWLSRMVRTAREECCDTLAVEAGADRVALAQGLVALAEQLRPPVQVLTARSGSVVVRVARLLRAPAPRWSPWRSLATVSVLPLVSLAAVLAVESGTDVAPHAKGVVEVKPSEIGIQPFSPATDGSLDDGTLAHRIMARLPQVLLQFKIVDVRDPQIWSQLTNMGQAQRMSRTLVRNLLPKEGAGFEIMASPSVQFYSSQLANASFCEVYSFVGDYDLLPSGDLDPQTSNLVTGETLSAQAVSIGTKVQFQGLASELCDILGAKKWEFTQARAGQSISSTYQVEVVTVAKRVLAPVSLVDPLGPDEVLIVPFAPERIERSVPHIAAHFSLREMQDPTKEPPPQFDSARNVQGNPLMLVSAEQVVMDPEWVIKVCGGGDIWWKTPVTFAAHAEPLREVLNRLADEVPVPFWISELGEQADLRINVPATTDTLARVLSSVLSQTLLVAKFTREGIQLLPEGGYDHALDVDATATSCPPRKWSRRPVGIPEPILRRYDLTRLAKPVAEENTIAQRQAWVKLVRHLLPNDLPAEAGFQIQGSTLILIAPEYFQAEMSAKFNERADHFQAEVSGQLSEGADDF